MCEVQAQKVYFSPSLLIFARFLRVERTKLLPHCPHLIFVEKQFRVSALLPKQPSSLRRAISAGELTGYKIGKSLRVRLDELDAWAMSKAMPNPRTMRPVKAGGVR